MTFQVTSISTLHLTVNRSIESASGVSRTSTRLIVFGPTSKFSVSMLLCTFLILDSRSTMAWGLEARVPFLDKAFLEVALNIDAKEKMFNKGANQEVDEDGCPKMEKVRKLTCTTFFVTFDIT
jgi:asparagine synthetase B (glutamine-hydrolysing)